MFVTMALVLSISLCGVGDFVHGLLKLLERLPDGAAHLWQALGAEDEQGNDRDEEQFCPVKSHSVLSFCETTTRSARGRL